EASRLRASRIRYGSRRRHHPDADRQPRPPADEGHDSEGDRCPVRGSCLHLRGSRHQEVLADQVAVEVLTDELVVLMPELGQTRGVVLQGLHQADRGPARLLEEMAVVLGTQGRRDLHGTVERHIADGGPQTLHDDVRVSPLMGRCRFRIGRRHVGGREGEHPTDEQLRRPRVEGDAAPRFQDPQHFLDGDFRTRGEDVGELAQHDVELSIAEWKALHIALLPGDVVRSAIAAFSLATARSSGVRSKPVTTAPARRAVIATTPVPHPTSSTRWFGRTPAKCTSFAALGVVVMASGANVFQFSRCIALNAWNGSEVMLLEGGSGYRLITLRSKSGSGWTSHEISISPSVIVPDTVSPVDSWIANVSFPTPGFATSCMTIRNPA